MPDPLPILHPLTDVPAGATLRSVTAGPAVIDGKQVLSVRLTDAIAADGHPGVDYVDQPTFVIIPADFTFGTIDIDVSSGLTPTAPDFARGFAGLAYHLTGDGERFEAVYLRPLNGATLNPPSPRHLRAVQYFAYPDWPFDRLRDTYPEETYEAGADIRPDEWIHLQVRVTETGVSVLVDDSVVLTVAEPKAVPIAGSLGLFVDIGTQAYFSDLRITSRHE
ncbi:MAG TPA: hypothetical protein VIT41_19140 [Microlunatus sp.]